MSVDSAAEQRRGEADRAHGNSHRDICIGCTWRMMAWRWLEARQTAFTSAPPASARAHISADTLGLIRCPRAREGGTIRTSLDATRFPECQHSLGFRKLPLHWVVHALRLAGEQFDALGHLQAREVRLELGPVHGHSLQPVMELGVVRVVPRILGAGATRNAYILRLKCSPAATGGSQAHLARGRYKYLFVRHGTTPKRRHELSD
mmetsp:Transcript_49770/g.111892  ORF Transcript_49770/g.111892 Transcript_49770/m.111892 type:complete len:205 (+) Transcript_49770:307-921(+)